MIKHSLRMLPLLLILQAGNMGCAEIDIENTDPESFKYWCLVSGGEWMFDKDNITPDTPLNVCRCGSSQCGKGIVCTTDGKGEVECAAPPTTSSVNTESGDTAH